MKRRSLSLVVIMIAIGAWAAVRPLDPHDIANPDPDHIHADFAVWVMDHRLDFSDMRYMSGSSSEEDTHPHEGLRQNMHLHDGRGNVLHMHAPGITLGEFLESLGLHMTRTCLTLDEYQMQYFTSQVDEENALTYKGFKMFFAGEGDICTGAMFQWQLLINGIEQPFDPSYQPKDLDQILLIYHDGEADQTQLKRSLKAMTDDACLSSKRCPWRGVAPKEDCVADPAIPCVE